MQGTGRSGLEVLCRKTRFAQVGGVDRSELVQVHGPAICKAFLDSVVMSMKPWPGMAKNRR